MNKVYLVENNVNDHRVFEAFSDAMMYAMELIERDFPDKTEKAETYKELFISIAERDIAKWGFGYCIDEYLWCWEVPFKAKSE